MAAGTKLGSLRVKHGKIRPNDWNPNEMDPAFYGKLKRALAEALAQKRKVPPIIVRPHAKGYEIIDGYHRHKALGELGETHVNVFSIDADDKNARVLTNTLNYLRGQPNRQKYGQGVVELLEMGASLDELAEVLPETRDDLELLLEESNVSMEALAQLHRGENEGLEELTDSPHEDTWVEFKFKVSLEQSEVIEAELARIAAVLKGKNIRGRSLEYMAARSSQQGE
jgi:ParB-like chromosome segregation protein Spo0J